MHHYWSRHDAARIVGGHSTTTLRPHPREYFCTTLRYIFDTRRPEHSTAMPRTSCKAQSMAVSLGNHLSLGPGLWDLFSWSLPTTACLIGSQANHKGGSRLQCRISDVSSYILPRCKHAVHGKDLQKGYFREPIRSGHRPLTNSVCNQYEQAQELTDLHFLFEGDRYEYLDTRASVQLGFLRLPWR